MVTVIKGFGNRQRARDREVANGNDGGKGRALSGPLSVALMKGNYLAARQAVAWPRSSRNYARGILSPAGDPACVYCILYGDAPCFVKASPDSTDVNDVRGEQRIAVAGRRNSDSGPWIE
ncbi:hypothetical protein K0M31_010014 [Melipona bicolor]|uniref:Uncharacterized protein n=1 Tax=Melipona bicolor TaxID=60889 RepID=A0AA40FM51_9HYME|nr:hypothetical protein K0M31_010014 [Melipona bicolor]